MHHRGFSISPAISCHELPGTGGRPPPARVASGCPAVPTWLASEDIVATPGGVSMAEQHSSTEPPRPAPDRARPATIYDVARLAGVAPSTVSRAFARPGRVKLDT